MARYGQAFKDKAVARLLPPESASLADVAPEFGVSIKTLEKWRDAALLQPAGKKQWTPAARFEALLTTASLNEQERSAWCRTHGVNEDKAIRHQVFDLPQITPEVTEYLRLRGVCSGCGHKHHAALPTGVPSGQLGPRALALVGTLSGQFHLTQGKVQRLLEQVMGLKFSIGTISMAHGHVAQALAEPVRQLHTHLSQEPVRHADETSHKSHNHMMWAWTQVCDWGAYFRLDPSRGQVAAKALLGEQPQGVIVSDRYAGYHFIDLQQRQVCWAHLLRDFARIAPREGVAGVIGKRLQACGYALFRWREQGKPAGHFEWLQHCVQKHLQAGVAQTACSRTANTCANLLKIESALWHFLRNPAVPPTNNAAERALRGFVIKRKLSFFTRSGRGLRFLERIFSTVQTCALQGRQVCVQPPCTAPAPPH